MDLAWGQIFEKYKVQGGWKLEMEDSIGGINGDREKIKRR